MAQIKHIAIRTRNVDQTAAFYKDAFGLTQVGTGKNGVYLTDGHLNIAILKYQQSEDGEPLRLGVDHIGFQVEDLDSALARVESLRGIALSERTEVSPKDAAERQSYYEIKCIGPDEQVIDISTVGWIGAK